MARKEILTDIELVGYGAKTTVNVENINANFEELYAGESGTPTVTWDEVQSKPAVIAAGEDAAAARAAIGAGVGSSNLAIGTTSTTAKAGDYQPTAANISDATATGRSVLTAANAAAARTAIGAGVGSSNLVIGTTSTTAKAGDYQPTAANISDATAVGRSVLTAADAAAARTAIGAGVGTSNLAIGTTGTTAMAGNKVPTATERGGVLQQAAIADLPDDPVTGSELNTILAALRAAGILAT